MPKYYFDIVDLRGPFHDDVGTELTDDAAAQREASATLVGLAKCQILDSPNLHMWIVVSGADREPLFEVQLTSSFRDLKRSLD